MGLYRVVLRGMKCSLGGGIAYGISYVVAEDTDAAYKKVKSFLDENKIGFYSDRVLERVELLAEECKYPGTGTMLFL